MLMIFVPIAENGDSEYKEMDNAVFFTYDEALELTLELLPAIKDFENLIEELEEQLDDISDFRREMGEWLSYTTLTMLRRVETEIERQIEIFYLEINMIELRAELTIRNAISDIAIAEIDIEIMEAAIILAYQNLQRLTILHQHGRVSANELRQAENLLNQKQMSLENLQLIMTIELEGLNHILGQPPYQLTVVEFERTQPELPEDLTHHISQTVRQAPSIRQMQINTDRYDDEVTIHMDRCNYAPRRDCEAYIVLREAYERVALDQRLAERAMEAALRTAYNELLQLQIQEEAARLALTHAIEDYEIARINHNFGRVTRFDIEIALNAVFIEAQAIERILYRQWLLEFILTNPVLL